MICGLFKGSADNRKSYSTLTRGINNSIQLSPCSSKALNSYLISLQFSPQVRHSGGLDKAGLQGVRETDGTPTKLTSPNRALGRCVAGRQTTTIDFEGANFSALNGLCHSASPREFSHSFSPVFASADLASEVSCFIDHSYFVALGITGRGEGDNWISTFEHNCIAMNKFSFFNSFVNLKGSSGLSSGREDKEKYVIQNYSDKCGKEGVGNAKGKGKKKGKDKLESRLLGLLNSLGLYSHLPCSNKRAGISLASCGFTGTGKHNLCRNPGNDYFFFSSSLVPNDFKQLGKTQAKMNFFVSLDSGNTGNWISAQ